jgi:hypothetical protein
MLEVRTLEVRMLEDGMLDVRDDLPGPHGGAG